MRHFSITFLMLQCNAFIYFLLVTLNVIPYFAIRLGNNFTLYAYTQTFTACEGREILIENLQNKNFQGPCTTRG